MDSLRVQWVIPTGWRFLPGTSTRALSTEPLAGRSCQRMRWRTQKLDHAAHKQLPGKRLPPWKRGRRNFLHPPRVLQSALSGPSEMWDGAYFNRNPPVTHKRTNISSQWFITARLHDTNSVQWCRACLLKNKQRKGKRYYFTARASGLCYDCGSTNPHTLIFCTTLPARKDNCNCKTHHSHEVWAGNTEDYTFVHSSAIYTNTAWMCNTLQQAVRAVSPASPAKTADALMQKNTAALMAKQQDGSVSQKTSSMLSLHNSVTAAHEHVKHRHPGAATLNGSMLIPFIYFDGPVE